MKEAKKVYFFHFDFAFYVPFKMYHDINEYLLDFTAQMKDTMEKKKFFILLLCYVSIFMNYKTIVGNEHVLTSKGHTLFSLIPYLLFNGLGHSCENSTP